MFSDIIHRGAVQFFRQLSHGSTAAPSRRRAWARLNGDLRAFDHVGERAVVLRILIEEFGGEVVSSTLHQRLVHLASWKEAKSDLWVRRILGELEHCGALTLEDLNWTEVIARIQPTGVSLAYDPPALRHPGRSATP